MKYSRSQINKAGEILVSSSNPDKLNNALDMINDWRANHLHPLYVLKNRLIRLLERNKIKPLLISQRLKRLTSIEYKLDLNPTMRLGGMQDIGGFRAVFNNSDDLSKGFEIIKKDIKNHKLEKIVDYINKPKSTGYRSIHFVYKYNSKSEKYNGARVELQIRTKLQHNWATAVETAGIFTKTSLKSNQGPDEWLDFFKIVSSLFAMTEALPVLEEHKEKEKDDLMIECYDYCKTLNVINILTALRITARHIETNNVKGDYYIINVFFQEAKAKVDVYIKSDYEKATKDYLEYEKAADINRNAVVLVSANSFKALKEAYPSYFLDTSEFIAALESINDACEKLR